MAETFDQLKSVSRGYTPFDYDLVISNQVIWFGCHYKWWIGGMLCQFNTHETNSEKRGKDLADKLKELIPRQMFDVAIPAAIGSQIIARTTVSTS